MGVDSGEFVLLRFVDTEGLEFPGLQCGLTCMGLCYAVLFAAGTESADQARELDLPLKERFYLQPKTPQEAADRIKEAIKAVKDVKPLIQKKAWPYIQNGLRSSASYLRYDLSTIEVSKPKAEKKAFKALKDKALDSLNNVLS